MRHGSWCAVWQKKKRWALINNFNEHEWSFLEHKKKEGAQWTMMTMMPLLVNWGLPSITSVSLHPNLHRGERERMHALNSFFNGAILPPPSSLRVTFVRSSFRCAAKMGNLIAPYPKWQVIQWLHNLVGFSCHWRDSIHPGLGALAVWVEQ